MLFNRPRADAGTLAAASRVKDWTRARFRLGDDDAVMVTELSCGQPGCPPLETVVVFWTGAAAARHQFKVFKSLPAVTEEDLPPAFLKPTLASDGNDISCC